MEKLKLSAFDAFGALLPGIPLLIAFTFLYAWEVPSITRVVVFVEGISLSMSFAALVAAYCIGFVAQYSAYEIFKLIMPRIWTNRLAKLKTSSEKSVEVSIGKRGEELSAVRHHSAANAETLNTFLALRTMSYNFFFSFLVLALTCAGLWACIGGPCKEPLIIIIGSLVFSITFLRRAVSFHEWSQHLLTDTLKILAKQD